MRTRAVTALTALAVLIGVGACKTKDNTGGTSAGDVGAAGTTTTTDTAAMGAPPAGSATSITTDSIRRADSLRADSISRGTKRP